MIKTPKVERRHLYPREVTLDPAFQFRHYENDKAHVRSLIQVLHTVGDLDPILVWQEKAADGKETERLILLDGRHRLAAYANVKGHCLGIPARIFYGDLEGAMLAAVQANSRESLPLSKNERMDAAWKLVRLPGRRITVRAVAGAAGVAPRTVDMMRKRWLSMVATGKQPTGQWWRDRQDDLAEKMDCPEMTDKERRERIKQAATLIKEAFGKLPWQDEQLAAEALQAAVGTNKLRGMARVSDLLCNWDLVHAY